MAKKTKKAPKASRNVLVIGTSISKGRGKNKRTETKTKKGRLGTKLFCIALVPVKKGADRKKAKYECFGSWEDAQVAFLARHPSAAASNAALKDMLAMQDGMSGLRALRSRGRGLRGTSEEHREAYEEYISNFRRDLARHGGDVGGLSAESAFHLWKTLHDAGHEARWAGDVPRWIRKEERELSNALYERFDPVLMASSGERWRQFRPEVAKNVDKSFLVERGVAVDKYDDEPPAKRFFARK